MFPDTSRCFPVLLVVYVASLLTLGSSQSTTSPDEIWCGDNCIDTKYAIATFATYGLEGTVKVIEGDKFLYLEFFLVRLLFFLSSFFKLVVCCA